MSNTYIETYNGIAFEPLCPRIQDIAIDDIAHALSLICRFTGHTKYHYSVAQHSINIVNIMSLDGYDFTMRLKGLLHDASEAYICDVARPIKPHLENYMLIEKRLQNKIYQKYNLIVTADEKKIIKKYDDILLNEEAIALTQNRTNWAKPQEIKYRENINLTLQEHVMSEITFLKIFYGLLQVKISKK